MNQLAERELFWNRLFWAALALYSVFQIVLFARVLHYFPNGFPTENYYHTIAVFITERGLQGILDYLGGAVPPDLAYGPAFRPPLYSIVLSLLYLVTGPHEIFALVLNNLLLSAAIVFCFLIARTLGPISGFFAPLLMMFDAIFLSEANSAQSDTLFLFLIMTFTWLMITKVLRELGAISVAVAALVLVAAAYTRVAALYLGPVVILFILIWSWRRFGPRRAVVAALIFAIIQTTLIGVWMQRNKTLTGVTGFTVGAGALHLTTFYLPLVYVKKYDLKFTAARERIAEELNSDPTFADADAGVRERKMIAFTVAKSIAYLPWTVLTLADNAAKLFLSYPLETFSVFADAVGMKAYREFDKAAFESRYERSLLDIGAKIETIKFYWRNGLGFAVTYGIWNKIVTTLTLALAALGLFLLLRDKEHALQRTVWMVLIVLLVLIPLSILLPSGRFRLPLVPLLAIPAAHTIEHFARRIVARAQR